MAEKTTTSLPVKNQARLTEGPIATVLLKMTASMMIGFVAGAAFNITDTYFVSRLGTEALAAMGYIFPVTMIIFGISMGIGIGAASCIARTIGQGDSHKVQRLTVDALLLALLLVGFFIVFGLLTVEPLFKALGAGPKTLPLITDYMRIWYFGMAFLVVPIVGNSAIRATGDTLSPSIIMLIDIGLNIILDPILIFGLDPIPAMGIQGAAIATVFCRGLALLASIYILGYKKNLLTAEKPLLRELWHSWKQILYVGIPASFCNILAPIAAGVLVRLASPFGSEAVAAFSAGSRIEGLATIPIMAVGASLLPFVGQNWGAGNIQRVQQAYMVTRRGIALWGILSAGVIVGTNPWITRCFTHDPLVIKHLSLYLYIVPIIFVFRGLCHNTYSVMNAINRPYHATINMVIRVFIFIIPLTVLGGWLFKFKGLLVAIVIAEILSTFITLRWIKILLKNKSSKILCTKKEDVISGVELCPVGK